MTKQKKYCSDRNGYSFLLILCTLAVGAVVVLLRYILNKIEIMYPALFEQERALPEVIIYSLMIFFAAVYVVFALIVLRFWHRSLSYVLTENEIISDAGFIVRSHQIMKYSAVQYVSRVSMPLSRISSFNFVIVSALGGRLLMMFLSDSDAEEITELIRSELKFSEKELQ